MSHPQIGSIIHHDGFDYHYVGSYHSDKHLLGQIPVQVDYESTDPDYLLVKAVFKYKEKFYYIPAMFSMLGTIDPSKEWTLVAENVKKISELDIKICRKVCPGYLDR